MAEFLWKTRGNASPTGKPRVYFTCHPADFEQAFDKICEDLLRASDCAIYYTADLSKTLSERDRDVDLGQMNLFAVPVTLRLMHEPNRAMREDVAFAKRENIPILPILMESGIDSIYAKEENFGQRQYLDPYTTDETAISYADKLKKHLESVLISDETAKRVRAAFDAYVFLSYRKKDRAYANELMRLIHQNPEYRDVAIWYDEFLTPGESFRENIDKMLADSKLFALLVTPNLLEETDGKPNFVMGEEYPAARRAGKEILPAEMEETDREKLRQKFDGIPACVNPADEEGFRSRLLDAIERVAIRQNDRDPAHNFLIGLAYLGGIDVEVDRARALELITSAAEAELPEAMDKLYHMYAEGEGVPLDFQKAAQWAQKLADHYVLHVGEQDARTLMTLHDLAYFYHRLGEYRQALEINQKAYRLRCELLGERHAETLSTLNNLASEHYALGEYQTALDLTWKAHTIHCAISGEKDPGTLAIFCNLAPIYNSLGKHQTALELAKEAYDLHCEVFGASAIQALPSLNILATAYHAAEQYREALAAAEEAYNRYCESFGEGHPDSLISLYTIASARYALGDTDEALELYWESYELRCQILGERHPETLHALSAFAFAQSEQGNHPFALELYQEIYTLRCELLGEQHPDTIYTKEMLSQAKKAVRAEKRKDFFKRLFRK